MIEISYWPCIVVSSQRTGSSVLTKLLAQQYNVDYYLEPFEQNHFKEDFIKNYKIPNCKFIVKFMIDRIFYNRHYNNLIYTDEVYKIRLYRQNTVAQVASMYIAQKMQNWFSNQLPNNFEINHVNYTMEINKNEIISCLKHIIKNNNILISKKYKYNLTINYEQLGVVNETIWKRTILPINYNDIIYTTQDILRKLKINYNFIIT
jgi:LPS sulfotransferase NodH